MSYLVRPSSLNKFAIYQTIDKDHASIVFEGSEDECYEQLATLENKIKVILCRAGEIAKVVEIEDKLETFQKLVGGYIEEYMPFEDEVALICSDDAKMIGASLNRAIRDHENRIFDVVAGDFFICYAPAESEKFLSLPTDLCDKYLEIFKWPEQIILKNNGITAYPYNPETRAKEVRSIKGLAVEEPMVEYRLPAFSKQENTSNATINTPDDSEIEKE